MPPIDITNLIESEIGSYQNTTAEIELMGQVVKIQSKPLTGADLQFITRKHPGFMNNPDPEGIVDMLIRKARGDDGKKMFTVEHKNTLLLVRSDKLLRLFADLFKSQIEEVSEEDAEARVGNSEPIR